MIQHTAIQHTALTPKERAGDVPARSFTNTLFRIAKKRAANLLQLIDAAFC